LTTARLLTTDLAGLRNQALGLAEAAGFAPDARIIARRPPWSFLPLRLWPDPLAAITPAALAPPQGDVLIGCGGAAARVLAALRTPRLPAVIIQNPRMDAAKFDLIVAARHDGITGPNVIVTRTAMHRVSPARLAAERLRWAPSFAHLPRPLVAVLLGGSNGRYRLDAATARRLAGQLARMMARDKTGLMLTPSRRTAPAIRAIFAETLALHGAYLWDMAGENPYFGMLACADAIVVTADSVSMVSEAAATGAPVLLARLPGRSARIGGFMDALAAEGRVRDFAGELAYWPVQPINDTEAAASEMRRRLGL
jgi:mitochondrial fission protein ELM1